jgi:hypothetical protein
MNLRVGTKPCEMFTKRLYARLHFEFVRHSQSDYFSHHEARVQYVLDGLRLAGERRSESPIRIDTATGAITLKCDTPDCHNYCSGDSLRRVKVSIMIDDPSHPGRRIPIQKERDLCPHCAALSSRSGTQEIDPRTPPMAQSKSTVSLWGKRDRRTSEQIDPATLELMRRRYK